MNRRDFVRGTLALGAVVSPAAAWAEAMCGQPNCNPMNGYCEQSCTVGLPTGFVRHAAARQQSSQWCWAACIEMVFRAHGYLVPQALFVQQTFGQLVNMPGQPQQIMGALNRVYVDQRGRRFRAQGDVFSVNLQSAAQDLAARQPLIVGALGHATVLTALSWRQANTGQWQITEAIVRDPWPGRPSRRPLSPQEWFGISFAARVRCWPA